MLLLAAAVATMIVDGHKCTSTEPHIWTCRVPVVHAKPSGNLQRYLDLTLPVARKIGRANAMTECGLDQYRAVADFLNEKLYQDEYLGTVRQSLTAAERSRAETLIEQTARSEWSEAMGGTRHTRCMALADTDYRASVGLAP